MNITIQFRVPAEYLGDLGFEAIAIFENMPYVPEMSTGLWVKWEDFYSADVASKIYNALRSNMLIAHKLMERFEKDRIFVDFEYLPFRED